MPTFSNIITGINTGLAVYGATQQQGGHSGGACRAPSGCFQCQMKGRGDIAGCIDILLNGTLYQLLVRDSAGLLSIPNNEVLQQYQNGLAALNNAAYFQQGSDAYLASAKAALQAYIDRYRTAGNTNTGATVNVLNSNGTISTVPAVSNLAVAGIPNSYLIGGGIALLGLVFLLKR